MSRRTGIVQDDRYLRHGPGHFHPESPKRLEHVYAMLQEPDMRGRFHEIPARHADHAEIERVHRPSYINLIASTAGKSHYALDPDTETTADSYDTARLAVGGVLNAIDAVLAGEVDNAFAFIRPPGHHAGRSEAAGFCLFNNVAIGAMHALAVHRLERVLIIDWDLHHGNGTQDIFYGDKRVLYVSTHEFPAYPGSGSVEEIGSGEGRGFTVNIPLPAGTGNSHYVKVFKEILEPIALAYGPQLILVSAGFDTYFEDPLGGMQVTPEGFTYMTRILMDIADRCCQGRLVFILEGGYNVSGLTKSVKAVLNELSDETHISDVELERVAYDAVMWRNPVIARVIERMKPIWPVF